MAGEALGALAALSLVEGALQPAEPAKRVKIEAVRYVRASSVAEFCPREQVLLSTENLWGVPDHDPDRQLNFDLGSGMHWAMQNKVLPNTPAFVGNWTCMDCGAAYGCPPVLAEVDEVLESPELSPSGADLEKSLIPRPKKCLDPQCGSGHFVFREPFLYNATLRLGGHPDGFLRFPGRPGLGILEVKSIGASGMKTARFAPTMEHIIQLHSYFLLTGFTWGLLLYWEKGRYGRAAIAEHIIPRDEEMVGKIKTTIASYWAAMATWNGSNRDVLPARVCGHKACPRAADCAVVGVCFEGEDREKGLEGF